MKSQLRESPPININVQVISHCSGIFISDSNVIYGWSSHGKDNIGFGSLDSSNFIKNNATFIFDSDYADTLIDDRDVHAFVQNQKKEPSTQIIGFDKINVNSMQQNSGVFVGQSNINGQDTHEKENVGYGSVYGTNNRSLGNVSVVHDPDLVDGVIHDQDYKQGIFLNS
ncbi:hypothetical protein [Alicyclobacillus dauci]|uniref:Uncharacterized protein n=1 Tax=Alicyclobacillus dauci TaxID=1475485 RepID=A0ABY6YXK8_9BACL|nr:hypothetical protein [Alicyclobacillus dauci]WAH35266.1 hypothetical protein NZD86_13200 [Alicyclobacillus dauci]